VLSSDLTYAIEKFQIKDEDKINNISIDGSIISDVSQNSRNFIPKELIFNISPDKNKFGSSSSVVGYKNLMNTNNAPLENNFTSRNDDIEISKVKK
jgi:hypothetical protein